jgi:hypothetical protein
LATRTRDLTDQVNGVATTFSTVDDYLPGTLEVFLNGVRQRRDVFFFESGARGFVTTEAPHDDDALSVQYEVVGPGEVIVFPTVGASGIDPAEH